MAWISTDRFERVRIVVRFLNQVVEIDAWEDIDTGTVVVPMQELQQVYHIDYKLVQRSEWLALEHVSAQIVQRD
jgi:hypothetical protein